MTRKTTTKKENFRYNIYYSSPYYRLHDGDDKGPEVYRTPSSIDIHEKQIEFEEKHLKENLENELQRNEN